MNMGYGIWFSEFKKKIEIEIMRIQKGGSATPEGRKNRMRVINFLIDKRVFNRTREKLKSKDDIEFGRRGEIPRNRKERGRENKEAANGNQEADSTGRRIRRFEGRDRSRSRRGPKINSNKIEQDK